eukprot:TRINITY_DN2215_c0_g1_i3.p1 TRINITY_DN2215_c0_g1~~TRINITY_DN2215_c0_g1_i3.p1  ORF type:complete len:229 (+),score=48.21 TRINITY_DN2215_c0_g1_i3:455-1141(+)
MKVCQQASEFWFYQINLSQEQEKGELRKGNAKVQQIEKLYTEKLEDASNKIMQLKRQLEVGRKESENDKKEIQDLQDKYGEKSRQKRKLEELYDQLKSKIEGGGGMANPSANSVAGARNFSANEDTAMRRRTAGGPAPPPLGYTMNNNNDIFSTHHKPSPRQESCPEENYGFQSGPPRKVRSPPSSVHLGGMGMGSLNMLSATPRRPAIPKPSIRIPESPKFVRSFNR